MAKNTLISLTVLLTITLGSVSCTQETRPIGQAVEILDNTDTLIVKHKRDLDSVWDVPVISKSYLYYWLVGKDTLDFMIRTDESKSDSSLSLLILHKKPILFTTTLAKINACFPLIKEDFYPAKLRSFDFRDPIYFVDLTKELSAKYEQQFGRKNISSRKLNQLFLNSNFNKQLDSLVNPYHKKVKHYLIEKERLIDKTQYHYDLPNVDVTEYPEFAITGLGLTVIFENKQK